VLAKGEQFLPLIRKLYKWYWQWDLLTIVSLLYRPMSSCLLFIIHITKIKFLLIKFMIRNQRSSNNAAHQVIFQDWYFTQTWITLVWPHHFTRCSYKTSFNPPHFIEVSVPSERACICCANGINFDTVSTIYLLEFGTVPTVLNFCF